MAFIYNGGSEPENHVRAPIDVCGQIDYLTPTGNYDIAAPAGYEITQIRTVVTQAFDGTPNLTIGDATDAAGYLTNANLALATAATASTPAVKTASGTGSANAYANGKYLTADGLVRFTWTKGTSPTTGVLKFIITMANLKKGGVPAGATTLTPL